VFRVYNFNPILSYPNYVYKSPFKYLKPESQITVTIFLFGPNFLALCKAAHTFAPEVTPPKIPSLWANSLAIK